MRTTTTIHVTRAALAALALAAAAIVAACGGAADVSGVPETVAASPATAASPVDPSPVDPTPVLVPTPVGGSEQPAIVVVAQNIEFQPGKLGVPANVPFTLVLDNRDDGVPHNIEVKDAAGASLFRGEIATGPTRLVMSLPALVPGEYPFTCTVHPNMTGVIVSQP